ncbi:MAG: type II secretion system F family protein [Gemmatales bacterium]|nr:type II secretion system F family protein [Gemmatales bacterium]MDW7994475.1 type II secretion system F family protein [Gemmatales bacterium]
MTAWSWLVPMLVFCLAAGVAFALVQGLANWWSKRHHSRKETTTPSSGELTLGPVAEALARGLPTPEAMRTELQRDLWAAGYYHTNALPYYLALRTALTLLPIIGALILALLVQPELITRVLVAGIILAALGFSLPRAFVVLRGRMRARAMERGLPHAVDMLTLCLTAGMNVPQALYRVSQELRRPYPILADEFLLAAQQAELRNLAFAMQQFADRTQVAEVQNLAVVLGQAERLGTDIAAGLLEYSSSMRTALRQQADGIANRASFWMLFPSVLCLFIPAVIILVGPAFLELREFRAFSVREDIRRLHEAFQQANPQALLPTPGAPPLSTIPPPPAQPSLALPEGSPYQ